MQLSWVAAAAGDLLLGAACLGCGEPWWGLCPRCRAEWSAVHPRPARPDPCPAGFPDTWTAGPYDELARHLITAHKEHQSLSLLPVLARRLARVVEALLAASDLPVRQAVTLVSVPSAPSAVRERGYDAGAAIARRAARELRRSRPVSARRLLRQGRRVQDQAGLGAADRHVNLAGSFRLRRPWPGPVVVVDDVVTTGASLTEAARAFTAGGVPVVGAATVAATVRRRPPGLSPPRVHPD